MRMKQKHDKSGSVYVHGCRRRTGHRKGGIGGGAFSYRIPVKKNKAVSSKPRQILSEYSPRAGKTMTAAAACQQAIQQAHVSKRYTCQQAMQQTHVSKRCSRHMSASDAAAACQYAMQVSRHVAMAASPMRTATAKKTRKKLTVWTR